MCVDEHAGAYEVFNMQVFTTWREKTLILLPGTGADMKELGAIYIRRTYKAQELQAGQSRTPPPLSRGELKCPGEHGLPIMWEPREAATKSPHAASYANADLAMDPRELRPLARTKLGTG